MTVLASPNQAARTHGAAPALSRDAFCESSKGTHFDVEYPRGKWNQDLRCQAPLEESRPGAKVQARLVG